jgi:hypothetical protein
MALAVEEALRKDRDCPVFSLQIVETSGLRTEHEHCHKVVPD